MNLMEMMRVTDVVPKVFVVSESEAEIFEELTLQQLAIHGERTVEKVSVKDGAMLVTVSGMRTNAGTFRTAQGEYGR